MSTPAKCHRVGQTSIYTMYDVRVPDRKKKKEGGGEGLYEYSSQVPISAPIDPRLTSNDANMRKLVFTPYQAGTICRESSKPDLIQNLILKVCMLRFLRHSNQFFFGAKTLFLAFWEPKCRVFRFFGFHTSTENSVLLLVRTVHNEIEMLCC